MSGKDNQSNQAASAAAAGGAAVATPGPKSSQLAVAAAAAGATVVTPGTSSSPLAVAGAAGSANTADLKGKLVTSFAAATPVIAAVRIAVDHKSDIVEAKNLAVAHPGRALHAVYQGGTDGVIDSALSGFGIVPSINILPNDKTEAAGGKGAAPLTIADAGAGGRPESRLVRALAGAVPIVALVDKSTNESVRQAVKDVKDKAGELAGIRKFEPRNETEAHVLGTAHAAAQTVTDMVGGSLVGIDLNSGALEKTGESMAKLAEIGKAAEAAEEATMQSAVLTNMGKAAEHGEKLAKVAREYIESNAYKINDSASEVIKGGDEEKESFRARRTVTATEDAGLVKKQNAMDKTLPLNAEFKKAAENIPPSEVSLKVPAPGPATSYKSPAIPM
jgi:hypothetical protein